ncbi:unnamed protein product [Closterium sp. NIES-64]|nr:unnamed protein product [Closterium sp. NIES-64]
MLSDLTQHCIRDNSSSSLRWRSAFPPKKSALLKDVRMDAPDDVVLRLAQLALRCTVQRTASRPSMADIANELQGMRHEVVGKEVLSAAVKVDELAEERRIGMSLRKSLGAELEAIKSTGEEPNREQ